MKLTKDSVVFSAVMVPVWPVAMLSAVGLMAAPGFLLYRIVFFLRDGFWLNSVCDVTTDATWRGGNIPDACVSFSTGWLGVDFITHWLLRTLDASLFALLITAVLWGAAMLWIALCGAMMRNS